MDIDTYSQNSEDTTDQEHTAPFRQSSAPSPAPLPLSLPPTAPLPATVSSSPIPVSAIPAPAIPSPSTGPTASPPSGSPPPAGSPGPAPQTRPLPDSVRGAPEELKPAIRKKQNKESARRSRRRRKELVSGLSQSLEVLLQRSADVEARVAHIERFLAGIGFQKLLTAPAARPAPASGPPSRSESMGLGSHSEAGSRNGRSRGGAARRRGYASEDEDVQRLIERCMGQL